MWTGASCPGPIERCGAVQALLRPAAGALHTCGLGVRRHPRAPQPGQPHRGSGRLRIDAVDPVDEPQSEGEAAGNRTLQ